MRLALEEILYMGDGLEMPEGQCALALYRYYRGSVGDVHMKGAES